MKQTKNHKQLFINISKLNTNLKKLINDKNTIYYKNEKRRIR